MVFSAIRAASWIILSRGQGIPSGRKPPFGLGKCFFFTGFGWYDPEPISFPVFVNHCMDRPSRVVFPSGPGVIFPGFDLIFRYAAFSVSGSDMKRSTLRHLPEFGSLTIWVEPVGTSLLKIGLLPFPQNVVLRKLRDLRDFPP